MFVSKSTVNFDEGLDLSNGEWVALWEQKDKIVPFDSYYWLPAAHCDLAIQSNDIWTDEFHCV